MVSIIYSTVSTNSMIMMWSMAKLSSTDAPLSNVDHWIPAPVVEKEDTGYCKFLMKFNITLFLISTIFSQFDTKQLNQGIR